VSPSRPVVERVAHPRNKTSSASRITHGRLPTFGYGLLLVTVVVVGALAVWHLRQLLLLLFAAILVALALRGFASGILLAVPVLGRKTAFVLASLLAAATLGGFGYLLGSQLRGEFGDIWHHVPELLVPLEEWFGFNDVEEWLVEAGTELFSGASVLNWVIGVSGVLAGLVANAVLVIIAAFYLGLSPATYRAGLLYLLPPSVRGSADETLTAIGHGLQRWIVGQFVAMAVVGILTFIGLWMLGVPSALALAVIAALLEFIPFVGPILAAIPALAIAFGESAELALWVLALYVLVQQIEGNVLMPLIQRQAVSLPPVATLFAVLAAGLLFGPLGILLATPLAVVCMIAVKKLWVRDALAEDVAVPGLKPPHEDS
jgi:predicted PurR-regulated permease PerM